MKYIIKPKIKLLFVTLLFVLATQSYALTSIDSLKNILASSKIKASEIEIIIDIAAAYSDYNVDSSLVYFNKAKMLLNNNTDKYLVGEYHQNYGRYLWRINKSNEALLQCKMCNKIYTELDSTANIALVESLMGNCYKDMGKNDSALYCFQVSLSLIDSATNSYLLAVNYNNIAIVYDEINRKNEALANYLTALTIFRKLKQYKSAAITLNNIGIINLDLLNYEKAIDYFNKAIEFSIQSEDINNLCSSYNSLGIAYKSLREYSKAAYYYTQAIKKSEEAGFTGPVAQSKYNLAIVFLEEQKYDSAILYFNQSLKLCKDIGVTNGIIMNYISIGDAFLGKDEYNSAEEYLLEALNLSNSNETTSYIPAIYKSLYEIYEKKRSFKKSIEYRNMYDVIKDSLNDKDRINQLNELQTKYETEQKELENQKLKDQNKINELTILRQRAIMGGAIFILAMAIAIVVLLLSAKEKRKKQIALLEEKNSIIKEKSEQLKESNETKDRLFSIIAHDLRSPFNSLLGFSLLLDKEVNSNNFDNVKFYAKHMRAASSTAFELVDNLLSWARTQQTKIISEFNLLLFNDVLDSSLRALQPRAAEKQITIDININSEIEIVSDPDMLMVILRNLISNAIKFASIGGKIEIGCVDDTNSYTIFVKDNGTGIAPEIIDGLLQNSTNNATHGTDGEKGSGLGLMLVVDFVNKLGGKFGIESTIDNGSTFSFTLPKHNPLA